MSRSWKDVWSRRTIASSGGSVLSQLMAADGLDTEFGAVSEDNWRAFAADVGRRLEIRSGESVFEVGCGAGALLYPFCEQGHRVGGIDQSEALLECAHRAMPGGHWQQGDAASLNTDDPWDIVISCGVFLYFPDLGYAERVLTRMTSKTRRAIAVLDVPDLARRDEALAYRRGVLGEREYEERYRGLDHLYFDRRWFVTICADLGFSAIEVVSQNIADYPNGEHRFNVFARFNRA